MTILEDPLQLLLFVLAALVIVYFVARLIFHAFFRSWGEFVDNRRKGASREEREER